MHRSHRTRRTIRRYTQHPAVRFTAVAVSIAAAVALVIVATETTATLPPYLERRPAAGLGAFWAVVALGLGVAFSAAAIAALRRLERTR